MMRTLLSGLLILAAAAALVTVGSDNLARVPQERTSGNEDRSGYREAVAEVVVTAERPAWLMPEVVVSANSMPEVVVYASWSPPAVAATSPQASFVN
jgi:hypothetical protein